MFGAFDPTYLRSESSNTANGRAKQPQAISDPYYGGRDGFDKCYEQCVVFAQGFLDYIEAEEAGEAGDLGSVVPSQAEDQAVREVMGM